MVKDLEKITDIKELLALKEKNIKSIEFIVTEIKSLTVTLEEFKSQKKMAEQCNRNINSRINALEENEFKFSAFNEYPDVLKDVKERVWSKAYQKGHSSGMHEVRNEFYDLMEIFD